MPIQTVESRRLYRQIADQLSGLIGFGKFASGCRLPPERELAALLGVSRASVREPLIALEIAGRVEMHVGAGIYVAAPGPVAIADRRSDGRDARVAMRRHLERVESEFNRGWELIKERESANGHADDVDVPRPASRQRSGFRSF